ncbi:MAG: hypothetical protein AAF399_24635, partial [Bacteroidota bacterium]
MKHLFSFFALFCTFSLWALNLHAQSSIPIRETTPFPDSVLGANSAPLPDGNVIVWGGQKQVQTPSGKIWLSTKSYIYHYADESWSDGPDLPTEVYSALVVP